MFTCPVCFFDKMPDAPEDYNICPCCGTEFGNDDDLRTPAQLRAFWMASGAKWFFHQPPVTWNPWLQLALGGVKLPYSTTATFGGSLVRSGGTGQGEPVFVSKPYVYTELAEAA
jgi:hypothetical protein